MFWLRQVLFCKNMIGIVTLRFKDNITYYQTESILENLDKKILEYVEENKAYARPNTRILKTIESLQKERTDLHKTLKQVEKEMLYYDKSVDRYEDYQQEHTKNKSQHSPRL